MKFTIILSPIIVFLVWFYFFATAMVWVEIRNTTPEESNGSITWDAQDKLWDKGTKDRYWVKITKPSEEIHIYGLKISVQQRRYRSWFGKPTE